MKTLSSQLCKTLMAVVATFYGQTAFGQLNDTQDFDVVVPALVSISAPVQETIDGNIPANQIDGDIAFLDVAPWTATSNDIAGASISFVCQGPFTNAAGGTPIDATLSIFAITSDPNSVWSTSVTSDSTSGAGTTATVSAASTGAGDATFDVDIVFNNPGNYSDLVSGSYLTTVVGTITGNSP